jgi:hypothetical protein
MFVQIFQQNPWESRTHLIYNGLHLSLPVQQSLLKTRRQNVKKKGILRYTRITKPSHNTFLYVP